MDNGLIPHRYAKALYKFALEHGNTEQVYKEMKSVIDAFLVNPSLQKVISNPFVSREDKAMLLKSAAGQYVENDYLGFIKLILDMNREEFALRMAYAYRDIYRKVNKISQVKVTTAVEMQKPEMDRLFELVRKSFPDSTLETSSEVNPDIIGGFVIDVDDSRMDASISNEIEQLRLKLLSAN
ncbi:MAG: F0F1 ATP synthase subunit delta [Clostridium sp.]|nr:F0F1 ATP synthase subunit delta [Prevotella sp.]MCM1429429.1 F0F1 ATP synthase subunit delta [Clostridium sp.]MCM1475536.1 F0F1 ATP synthase subunit delta [Muribaculaceae bacterium]